MGQLIRNGICYSGSGGGGLNVSKAILLESIVPSTNQALQYSQPIENFDYISITIHDSVGNSTCVCIPKENYANVFSIQTWVANNGYISFCPNTGKVNAANNCTIDNIIGYKFIEYSGSVSGSSISYSTEEQVIGTWIDGKPLYQKTVIGSFTNNCSLIYIGKVSVKSITGVINVTSGGSIAIGFSFNRTDSLYTGADYDFTTGNIEVFAKGWDISECIVTVLYTKTTD